jgi:hypothetical protein
MEIRQRGLCTFIFVSYYGDTAKRVVYFYICELLWRYDKEGCVLLYFKKWRLRGLICSYIHFCFLYKALFFSALCYYNLVTGTNKQSYSILNY